MRRAFTESALCATNFRKILSRLCCGVSRVASTNSSVDAALRVVLGKAFLHAELIDLFLGRSICRVLRNVWSCCTQLWWVSWLLTQHSRATWRNACSLRNPHGSSKLRPCSLFQVHITSWGDLLWRLRHVTFIIIVFSLTTRFWRFWAHLLRVRCVLILGSESLPQLRELWSKDLLFAA